MFGWFKRKKKRRQGRKRGHGPESNLFDWFHGMLLGQALAPDDSPSAGHHHHGHHDASPPPHDHSVPDAGTSDTSGGFDGGSSDAGGAGGDW